MIPLILEERDLVVKASAGYGKTIGFILPLLLSTFLNKQQSSEKDSCCSLVIHPTKEGSYALYDLLKSVTKHLTKQDEKIFPKLAIKTLSSSSSQQQSDTDL